MTAAARRLLCIGAHPDDCELQAAGLAALWTAAGGAARFVAMTDGGAGHQRLAGAALVAIRRNEARAGAACVGADSLVFDNPDGSLVPSLGNRLAVLRAVREFVPDVIVTHRTNDYHPDHRYTGVTVQDASYLVRLPNVLPGVPALEREPVVLFMSDRFTKPNPITPDLVLDLDPVIERKLDAVTSHASQVEEWLPWIEGYAHELPADPAGRRAAVRERARRAAAEQAERFRRALVSRYGAEHGAAVRFAEAYEVSEYAAPLSDDLAAELFPF